MKLTTKQRKSLKSSSFAFPKDRKYPIDTKNRARVALGRISQFGTTAQKQKVRASVKKKYPSIKVKSRA